MDIIIGGHSHSLMEAPCTVAGIPIVQAAYGTDQIGRFDILVDTDKNAIHSFTWKLVPIDNDICPRDLLEMFPYEETIVRKMQRPTSNPAW